MKYTAFCKVITVLAVIGLGFAMGCGSSKSSPAVYDSEEIAGSLGDSAGSGQVFAGDEAGSDEVGSDDEIPANNPGSGDNRGSENHDGTQIGSGDSSNGSQEDSADEEPLPLAQRHETPTDLASSIQPLNPEVPLSQRYEHPTDFASSIKPLDPASAPDEAVRCNPIPGGLFRCRQGTESFCATLLGERRECPAVEPTCEPIAGVEGVDRCREEGGSMSWCQASGSSERVKCPPVRTGRYTDRLCQDLGDYLRCISFRNDKFTHFCADPETGERTGCPQLAARCRAVDGYRREYACHEAGVSWCVSGKPINGEIYDPAPCSYNGRDVLDRGEPAVLSPESPNDPDIAPPTILWATPTQDGKWVEVGFRDESTVETLFHIEKAEGRCEENYRFTVRFEDMIRSNDTEGTGSTVRHSSPEGTTGYKAGETYCFRVVAKDALGNPSRSAGINVTMPTPPPAGPMHR